jgi:peptidoglycan/xylan/chitin deacetylase (PgdA/CDA1 family)
MLTFRNTNIFFIALLLVIVAAHFYSRVPWLVYAGLLLAYSAVVFWGCYFVNSNFFLPVICSAETSKRQIALSFDDGPSNQFTTDILEILNAENVKAAFFCIGKRIKENEQVFKQVYKRGTSCRQP